LSTNFIINFFDNDNDDNDYDNNDDDYDDFDDSMLTGISTLTRSTPTITETPPTSSNIPTIRLITATPSASGNSPSPTPFSSSWSPSPSPLLPKPSSPKTRLVPKKKSKLGLLGAVAGRDRDRDKDKDKDRERPIDPASARSFEIYVDPTDDPEIGEIVMVKKKKSRVGLDAVRWGPGALDEVTNVNVITNASASVLPKEVGKLKGEEKDGKWWSIGRGRKDSKEKVKSMLASTIRANCKPRVSAFCSSV
jgi:serine/arginine repetitive matrix protein 2